MGKDNAVSISQCQRPQPLPQLSKVKRTIRKEVGKYGQADLHKVILYPVTSDKNVQRMENENILTFIVGDNTNKTQIKKSFETLLNVKVRSVNTMIRPDGKKKAY